MPDTPSTDPAGRGAAHSRGPIESRLRAAREARGLSLTEVQQETRIPADVLQRLEDGRLLGDASFNPVYLKALLKAYAGAVGLPAEEVLEGFDPSADRLASGPPHAVVAGTTPAPPPAAPVPEPPAPSRRPDARRLDVTPKSEPPKPAATPAPKAAPDATPTAPVPAAPPARSPVAAVGAARVSASPGPAGQEKRRVMSAEVARTPRAFHRSWGLMIGGTLALVGVFALALFLLFRDRTPQPERRPQPAVADTAAVVQGPDTAAVEAPLPTGGPTLASPIRIAVTAGPGGLQNFRVTEEPNERLGHWIEEGQTVTFESSTAVVLWGEGAEGLGGDATLELQGLRWSPADNRVLRVDMQSGQGLLDSLAGARPAVPGGDG
jgi:hypothetical protein